MKVKFKATIGKQDMLPQSARPQSPEYPGKADGTPYRENEVADLKDADAAKLLEAGLVEVLTEAKK